MGIWFVFFFVGDCCIGVMGGCWCFRVVGYVVVCYCWVGGLVGIFLL